MSTLIYSWCRGKIKSTTEVKVSKDIYKDWDLEKVKKSSFSEWYDSGKQLLFYDGGFTWSVSDCEELVGVTFRGLWGWFYKNWRLIHFFHKFTL